MTWFGLVDEALLDSAMSGAGARLYGGRWNSPGVAMVYAAQSLSLAMLELLVHLEAEAVMRGHWRYLELEVSPKAIRASESWEAVPAEYAAWPQPASTRAIGDRWVAQAISVGLSVPSAITPGESNLLLNPAHPDYPSTVIPSLPKGLRLDHRLIKAGA